ncbi:MAG: Bax inhibitor-1/YccA family protein [Opitutales bacterium]|nr:Bax inhibitor-1/YccA family protein [Opitutales bacterium]
MFNAHTEQHPFAAAQAQPDARAAFIRRTYAHLAGALFALLVLETILLNLPGIENLIVLMIGQQYSWLVVLGLFMGATWMGQSMANSDTSVATQYFGLGVFVVAYAIIFLPILYIASHHYPGVIAEAGMVTLLLFAGLTATVFITRKDFSFLGPIVAIGGLIALGTIVVGIVFGFTLGLLFSTLMVALAAAAILYQTSNILHRYNPNQHVAASLALFGAVAMLFFYILRIFMARR